MQLFGIEITRAKDKEKQSETAPTFSPPANEDGAVVIQSGSYYGTYVDLDGVVRNEIELITRYRDMSLQPEIEGAIDDIINEAIVNDDNGHAVEINVDDLKISDSIKRKIEKEFDYVLKLMNFGNMGHEIFRRWYVDGRLFYHMIVDEERPDAGILELRYVDPRRIRKIREIQKAKDPQTGIEIIKKQTEYYLYNERGVIGAHSNLGSKIAPDSIVNVNSGLMDSKMSMVLSYLHKAIKPLNNVRMVEDATVIYRMSRAPERRIFYVDVGNMPTIKAEQYLKDVMTKYRNKLVYDATTGEIRNDRAHMSMLEDIWLPRREGSKGTEVGTLPAGQNLGELEDVKYFEKKLYKALGVPTSRLEQNQGFSLGRSTEITRDELKFTKFIQRLRNRFSMCFDSFLGTQLVLKKICTDEEWKEWKEEIWYDFRKDNNFTELKENELLTTRVSLLALVDPYVGKYFSREWVKKKVLQFTEDEIEELDEQIQEEGSNIQLDPNTGMKFDVLTGDFLPGQQPVMNGQQQASQNQQQQPEPPPLPSKFEVQPNEVEIS